jgi:AAA ATPase containing von Willebrand factor type A (vWA) domain
VNKRELLNSMRDRVAEIRDGMGKVEEHLYEISDCIDAKKFLSSESAGSVMENLEKIEKASAFCREQYEELSGDPFTFENLDELSGSLDRIEVVLGNREEVELALRFRALACADENAVKDLADAQETLGGIIGSADSMALAKNDDTLAKLKPYALFMKAYGEKRMVDVLDYIPQLRDCFSDNLVAALLDKQVSCAEPERCAEDAAETEPVEEVPAESDEPEEAELVVEIPVENDEPEEAEPVVEIPVENDEPEEAEPVVEIPVENDEPEEAEPVVEVPTENDEPEVEEPVVELPTEYDEPEMTEPIVEVPVDDEPEEAEPVVEVPVENEEPEEPEIKIAVSVEESDDRELSFLFDKNETAEEPEVALPPVIEEEPAEPEIEIPADAEEEVDEPVVEIPIDGDEIVETPAADVAEVANNVAEAVAGAAEEVKPAEPEKTPEKKEGGFFSRWF